MSFHTFTTMSGSSLIIINIGWDRPFQGYFMTIVKQPVNMGETDTAEDQEEYLFNHLDHHRPYPKEINTYLAELAHRGIELPANMVMELLSDAMRDIGNKYVEHCIEDGRYVRNQRF